MKSQYRLKTVQSTLELIELLADSPEDELGISEIASLTGKGKTEVFRILVNLAEHDYVQENPITRKYRLGLKFLQVGRVVNERLSLLNEAGPILDELARRTGETVHLVIKTPQGPVCIAERQTSHELRFFARIGMRLPWHAGSASKMLLATLPCAVQDEILHGELSKYTSNTIREPDRLRSELSRAILDGYITSYGEMNAGARAAAAPIWDHTGEVVAAVSVVAPDERADEVRMRLFIECVIAAGRAISERLGYHEGDRNRDFSRTREEVGIPV